ncbi:hypothetical protein ACFPN7_22560 [Amycolatopsis halotolerans]|uniref:hypothetical protein n=1 Tax=Amycolatopsis halotolerans TaxID=330083 RepID=UPI0036150093
MANHRESRAAPGLARGFRSAEHALPRSTANCSAAGGQRGVAEYSGWRSSETRPAPGLAGGVPVGRACELPSMAANCSATDQTARGG